MNTWHDLNSFLGQPVPAELWHYTSIAGFQGILESSSLFATDLRFLNDEREFTYALELIERIGNDLVIEDQDGYPLRASFTQLISYALTDPMLNGHIQMLVISFSGASDSLSQWRGYSQGSPGVSLAFDLSSIRPTGTSGTSGVLQTLAPCLYDVADQKRLVEACVLDYLKSSKALWKTHLPHEVKANIPPKEHNYGAPDLASLELHNIHADAQLRAAVNLMRVAALCKHPSFHEEKEWRLATPWFPSMKDSRPLKFRIGKNTLVPYTEEWLVAHPRQDLPLVSVIFGPGSTKETFIAGKMFLEEKGFAISPVPSRVPFRSS